LLLLVLRLIGDVQQGSVSRHLYLRLAFLQSAITLFKPAYFWFVPLYLLIGLVQSRRGWQQLVAVVIGTFIAWSAHSLYAYQVFGDISFSGYNYWVANPYLWLEKTFSLQYFIPNIVHFLNTGMVQIFLFLCLASAVVPHLLLEESRSERQPGRQALQALLPGVVTAGALLVFFSLYFYPAARLILPGMLALLYLLVSQMRVYSNSSYGWHGLAVFLLLSSSLLLMLRRAEPHQYAALRYVAQRSEPFVFVSDIHPLTVRLFRENQSNCPFPCEKLNVALSRNAEYASKLVFFPWLNRPATFKGSPFQHRAVPLIEAGAQEAITSVFLEQPLQLRAYQGSVYLFTDDVTVRAQLEKLVQLHETGVPGLFLVHYRKESKDEEDN
jgi:hypothetical protein